MRRRGGCSCRERRGCARSIEPAGLKWSENRSELRALRTEARSGTIAIPGQPSGDCRAAGTRWQRALIEGAGEATRVPVAFLALPRRRLGAPGWALVVSGRLLGVPVSGDEVAVARLRLVAREAVTRFPAMVIRAVEQELRSASQKLRIGDCNGGCGRSVLAAENRNGGAEHRNRDARSGMPAATAQVHGATSSEQQVG
jgi:hypothetical protein